MNGRVLKILLDTLGTQARRDVSNPADERDQFMYILAAFMETLGRLDENVDERIVTMMKGHIAKLVVREEILQNLLDNLNEQAGRDVSDAIDERDQLERTLLSLFGAVPVSDETQRTRIMLTIQMFALADIDNGVLPGMFDREKGRPGRKAFYRDGFFRGLVSLAVAYVKEKEELDSIEDAIKWVALKTRIPESKIRSANNTSTNKFRFNEFFTGDNIDTDQGFEATISGIKQLAK